MKVYDAVKKVEVEVDGTKGLIDIMRDGRQVDLYLKEKKTDADGYMSWDVEHWSSIDVKRFIRCYSLEGRVLGESTGHNIYDTLVVEDVSTQKCRVLTEESGRRR